MFWICLFLVFLAIFFWVATDLDYLGVAAFGVAILLSMIQVGAVWTDSDVKLIRVYEEQSLMYEAGRYETYEELYGYQRTIDKYNIGLERSQNGFLSWPYVDKEWKKCKKAEYPDDLHDKIIEALKKAKHTDY